MQTYVLLDTTVLIDLLRGREGAFRRMQRLKRAGDIPTISCISMEEVARGIRPEEVERALLLMEGLDPIPVGPDVAWQSGIWRRDHASKGITLHQSDCIIAATARACDARLVTGNPKDFPMPGIEVEHWPVGE